MKEPLRIVCWAMVLLAALAPVARADPIRSALLDQDSMQLPKGFDEVDQAIASFGKGHYDRCYTLLQQAAKKYPDVPPARLNLAKLYFLANQAALGRAALEQSAVETPTFPGVYLLFGKLALQEGRHTDARLQLEKAVSLIPTAPLSATPKHDLETECHAGLASLAERREDWPAAVASLSAWVALEPKASHARQRLARALFRTGKPEEALAALKKAVKDDTALDPPGIAMAQLFTDAKNLTKAGEWMETAVREAPDNFRAHLGYARWLLEQNQLERARGEAERAAKLAPAENDVLLARGLIAWYGHAYADAERLFQALHLASPASFMASNYLALTLGEQADADKRRRALELAETNLRLYPNSVDALTTAGRVYHRLGRLEDAEKALRTALTGGTVSADGAYWLACVLASKGQAEESKRLLKPALGSTGPFAFRQEAQKLFDQGGKEAAQRNP